MEQRTLATPFTGFLTKVGRDTLHDNIAAFIVVNPLCDRNPLVRRFLLSSYPNQRARSEQVFFFLDARPEHCSTLQRKPNMND